MLLLRSPCSFEDRSVSGFSFRNRGTRDSTWRRTTQCPVHPVNTQTSTPGRLAAISVRVLRHYPSCLHRRPSNLCEDTLLFAVFVPESRKRRCDAKRNVKTRLAFHTDIFHCLHLSASQPSFNSKESVAFEHWMALEKRHCGRTSRWILFLLVGRVDIQGSAVQLGCALFILLLHCAMSKASG